MVAYKCVYVIVMYSLFLIVWLCVILCEQTYVLKYLYYYSVIIKFYDEGQTKAKENEFIMS